MNTHEARSIARYVAKQAISQLDVVQLRRLAQGFQRVLLTGEVFVYGLGGEKLGCPLVMGVGFNKFRSALGWRSMFLFMMEEEAHYVALERLGVIPDPNVVAPNGGTYSFRSVFDHLSQADVRDIALELISERESLPRKPEEPT